MLPRKVIPFADPAGKVSPGAARSQQLVVQIGRDRELLRLRARIIHSAGYTVHSMTPDQVSAELRKPRDGQVWVFCHTLEFYELALLAVAIRSSWPKDKLLRLTGLVDTQQPLGLFDERLESVRGVDELLRVVGRMVKQSLPSQ